MIRIYFILMILVGSVLSKGNDIHKKELFGGVNKLETVHKILENPACCEERDTPCIDWAIKYNTKDHGKVAGIDIFANREKIFNTITIRESGYFELLNIGDPEVLPQIFSIWGKFKSLGEIKKAKSVLLNVIETKDDKNSVAMLIAVRFIVKTKLSYASYLGFIYIRFHGHNCHILGVKTNFFLATASLNHLEEDVLDIAVNTKIGRLYYSILDSGVNLGKFGFSSMHWVQSVDLTVESLQILFESPHIGNVKELEEAFGQYHCSTPAPISSFSLCDCKVAVGLRNGQVYIICCNALTRCNMIQSPCHRGNIKRHDDCISCKRFIIPIRVEWCCSCNVEKKLLVLYRVTTRCRIFLNNLEKTRTRYKTFIRAYSVASNEILCKDFTNTETKESPCKKCNCQCRKENQEHESVGNCHCNHEKRTTTRHIYSIDGCTIVNFRICCWKKCSLMYVLLFVRNKYYVRVFDGESGKYLATAQIEGTIDNHLMALAPYYHRESECEDSAECPCIESIFSTDEGSNHYFKSKFCIHCCKCGVILPVSVSEYTSQRNEKELLKNEKQKFDRIIVKVCAKI